MMAAISYSRSTDQQVSVIRKELVALTQDSQVAVVLNQLLYWSQRVKDFDLFLEEERAADPEVDSPLHYGWIYKTADELIEETLLTVTRPTMRKYLRILVEEGWVEERRNSDRKWDRTSHFRLNLKKINDELLVLGYRLPGFEKALFEDSARTRNLTSKLRNLTDQEKNLISSKESFSDQERNLTGQEKNLTSKLKNLTDEERNLTPKLKNLTAYTYTETTHKNTNREHTEKARVRTLACEENFSDLGNLENSRTEAPLSNKSLDESVPDESVLDESIPDESVSDESVAEEMIRLWEYHVVQKLDPANWQGVLHLTETRKDQLESLFAFYFQNDIRLWERFCLRVKAAPFLMGENPRKWHVNLDWILCDANLLKVLEGNYDDLDRSEQENLYKWDLAKMQPNPIQDAEKAEIIASIKDPVWKNWCSQLSQGVRLNELQMIHEPLSIADLRQISGARFLECEEERLVWVGSPDPEILRKIDDLRLKIAWVFEKEYPKARAFRTRLDDSSSPRHPKIHPSITGETYA